MTDQPPAAARHVRPRRWSVAAVVAVGVLLVTGAAVLHRTGPPATPAGSSAPTSAGAGPPSRAAPPPGTAQVDAPDGGRLLTLPRGADGRPLAPSGRADLPTFPHENPHSLGPAVVSPRWTSGIVADAQVLLADQALPWRWWVHEAVPGAVDLAVLQGAVSAWDDVPGSRWSSAFAGEHDTDGVVADGRSTVFLEPACEGLTTANAYLFTDGGIGVDRYGTRTTQILEADIGICPSATDDDDTLVRAVRHEVGHVAGLGHLCDPGDECWTPGMGEASLACRVMFWQARPCQDALSPDDRVALATLYPTLRPLAGPTPADTAARVAFASVPDRAAPVAVVVDEAAPTGAAPAAAALAARRGGVLLLASPDHAGCLAGPALAEADRALQRRGTLVLVGGWPDGACDRLAFDWDVRVRRVPAEDPVAASLALADLGGGADAVVVSALGPDGSMGDASVVAAAVAAAQGDPLLITDDAGTDPRVAAWIAARDHVTVTTVGAAGLAGGLGEGSVTSITGDDVVGLSLAAREVQPPVGDGVVLVPATGGPERLAAAVLAAHRGLAVLATGAAVDPRVEAVLADAAPTEGWVVDGEVLGPDVRASYGRHVDG